MAWVDALKALAERHKRGYKVPKKGTADYEEAKAIQRGEYDVKTKDVASMKEMKKAKAEGRKPKITKVIEGGKESIERVKAVNKRIKSMRESEKLAKKMGMKVEPVKKVRKVRSDKGQKRVTTAQIAKETVKQGILSKAQVYGRKPRSDKGKKRGPRKAKEVAKEEVVEKKSKHLMFDDEGNVI